MVAFGSRSHAHFIDLLAYLVDKVPHPDTLTDTDWILLISAITLGTLQSTLELGPAITDFLTERVHILCTDMVYKLHVRAERAEPLTHEDIEALLREVRQTELEIKLHDPSFQLELRNLFTRLDLAPELIARISEQKAELLITVLSAKANLLTLHTVNTLGEVVTQKKALITPVKHLATLVSQNYAITMTPYESAPPANHVFISYSHIDGEDLAFKLYDSLEADNIDAWLDRYDIKPGEEWDAAIQKAIEDCRLFVFIVTPGSTVPGVCKNEYMHAISTQRKIVCAMWKEARPPLLLNATQYIDLRSSFKQAIAQLRLILRQSIEEFSVNSEQAIEQRQRAVELIKTEAVEREKDRKGRSIFINMLPLDVSTRFVDRIKEQADILTLLKDKPRIISIYGRSGVGKTALVCKVLRDLQIASDDIPLAGMVYLGAYNQDQANVATARSEVSLDRILADLSKLLSSSAQNSLETMLKDVQMPTRQKVITLINELRDAQYILLLDNLEPMQNTATGELTDPDLRSFFEVLLERGGTLTTIITTRIPLLLPSELKIWEHVIPLEKGLPVRDAVQLLRALDANGAAGLQKAPFKKLKVIAEKTLGFPRALEAVVGLLLVDRLSSLDDLLKERTLLAAEVTRVIVQQAIVRLRPEATRVMDALALFGRPVTQPALEFLLAPYMDTSRLHSVLNQLVGAYFVEYNKTSRTLGLHPLDKEYCYNRIPLGSPGNMPTSEVLPPFTRYALHTIAADYYSRTRTSPDTWKTISDLQPQLSEFEHRLKAEDFNTAAELINEIDNGYLTLWGHARQVVVMREQLVNKIKDLRLVGANLAYLGRAYGELGQYRKAIEYAEQALDICSEVGNKLGKGTSLGVLGRSYRVLGDYKNAISYLHQALTIAREIEQQSDEVIYLGNLGIAWRNVGDYIKAIDHHRQALAIARVMLDKRGESYNLLNIGATFYEMGEIEQANECYEQTLEIVRGIGDRRRECDVLGNLGISYRALGKHEQAASHFRQARKVAQSIGDRRWEALWLDNLGLVCHYLGQYDQAVHYREESLAIAQEIKARRAESYSLAGLGKTYMALGQLTDALEKLSQAFLIATASKNSRDKQCWGTILAQCLIQLGQLDEAAKVMAWIRQLSVPENDHLAAEVDGIVTALHNDIEKAIAIFEETLSLADKLLAKTPQFYSAKYTRGLALTGLTLLTASDNRFGFLEQAQDAYRAAQLNCDALGVIKDAVLLLDMLKPLDRGEVLEQIKSVLMRNY